MWHPTFYPRKPEYCGDVVIVAAALISDKRKQDKRR
jgi:hypothetical protein